MNATDTVRAAHAANRTSDALPHTWVGWVFGAPGSQPEIVYAGTDRAAAVKATEAQLARRNAYRVGGLRYEGRVAAWQGPCGPQCEVNLSAAEQHERREAAHV